MAESRSYAFAATTTRPLQRRPTEEPIRVFPLKC